MVRHHGNQRPQFVNILFHHYEPLHYMLLFPHANVGWGLMNIADVPPLSQIDWYHSRLLPNNDDWFSLFGHLTCEYLVDMFLRTEEQRLAYINRERRFRAEELHYDHADEDDNDNDFNPSIRLPSSFVGSHAWASEQTADAMALGWKFRQPTFFCTMMFNPDWPEVQSALRPRQNATDAPIVVARVFKYCLEKVLSVLRSSFGRKVYLIQVVKFQKRGFPHAHIVFKVTSVCYPYFWLLC